MAATMSDVRRIDDDDDVVLAVLAKAAAAEGASLGLVVVEDFFLMTFSEVVAAFGEDFRLAVVVVVGMMDSVVDRFRFFLGEGVTG